MTRRREARVFTGTSAPWWAPCSTWTVRGAAVRSCEMLVAEGFDPAAVSETMLFSDAERGCFVPLDRPLFERIQAGALRL